jgi:hypothetical protein
MGFITFTARLELDPELVVVLILTQRAPDDHPNTGGFGTLKYGTASLAPWFVALDAWNTGTAYGQICTALEL